MSFARKLIRPFARIKKEDIDNEFRALNKLCKSGHPNIVQVLDYGQLKENGAFYFIDMEFCNASLEMYLQGQKVEGLSEWSVVRQRDEVAEHAYAILQHIINGLMFIHFLGEVHRDLSPQNGTHAPEKTDVSSLSSRTLENSGFWADIRSNFKSTCHFDFRPRQTLLSSS